MTSGIEDKLKELSQNLMESLCCGSDLPENDCTLEEILDTIREAYNIGTQNCNWHNFPDELPEDCTDVLTVAENPSSGEKHYHTFTFSEKAMVKDFIECNKNASNAFLQWCEPRHFDVIAWCKIPEYN